MMRRFVLGLLALFGSISGARATTLNAGDILVAFNAVVAGSVSTAHDIIGPVAIGGNLSGSGTFNGTGAPLSGAFSSYGAVNIYGNASGSFNANNLSVKIGGSSSATFSGASAVATAVNFPYTMNDLLTPLTNLSAALGGLSDTGTIFSPSGSNNAVISAKPATVAGTSNVAVVTISAGLLASYPSLSIAANGAGTVIINVVGNYTGAPNFQSNASNVIWNFTTATQVSLGTEWYGTVLAPYASVTNTNNAIDGSLFAASATLNGELHYAPFSGNVGFLNTLGGGGSSGGGTLLTGAPVPEPATVLLFAMGLAGLGIAGSGRRRRG